MKKIEVWVAQDDDGTCFLFEDCPKLGETKDFYYADEGESLQLKPNRLSAKEKKRVKCVVITQEEYKLLQRMD